MVDYLNLAAPNHFNLPSKIERLGDLAYNLWWTWHHDAVRLFSAIDNALWDEVHHNPVEFLHRVERPQYSAVMDDEVYMSNYASQIVTFDAYMNSSETWFTKGHPEVREKKIGNTIMFVVDSSGSMGVNRRMVETKTAILSLLVDAYQKRDKVGLVAFKGDRAEILLNPTSSVELAKKQLEELPTGGKTPLSKGLLKGYEVLRNELKRDKKIKPLLVVISDGKANVSVIGNSNPFNEAKQIAEDIKHSGIKSILIDTESGFIRLGKLQELSEALGGKYYLLEDIKENR